MDKGACHYAWWPKFYPPGTTKSKKDNQFLQVHLWPIKLCMQTNIKRRKELKYYYSKRANATYKPPMTVARPQGLEECLNYLRVHTDTRRPGIPRNPLWHLKSLREVDSLSYTQAILLSAPGPATITTILFSRT